MEKKLKELEQIAQNPNLKGGVWNSFSSFLFLSDQVLNLYPSRIDSHTSEVLKSIRSEFKRIFDIDLDAKGIDSKFNRLKSSPSLSHKFRAKLFNFMRSYSGRFTYKL